MQCLKGRGAPWSQPAYGIRPQVASAPAYVQGQRQSCTAPVLSTARSASAGRDVNASSRPVQQPAAYGQLPGTCGAPQAWHGQQAARVDGWSAPAQQPYRSLHGQLAHQLSAPSRLQHQQPLQLQAHQQPVLNASWASPRHSSVPHTSAEHMANGSAYASRPGAMPCATSAPAMQRPPAPPAAACASASAPPYVHQTVSEDPDFQQQPPAVAAGRVQHAIDRGPAAGVEPARAVQGTASVQPAAHITTIKGLIKPGACSVLHMGHLGVPVNCLLLALATNSNFQVPTRGRMHV
jgi:hypothetical protein